MRALAPLIILLTQITPVFAAPVPKEVKRWPEVEAGTWRIDWGTDGTRPYKAVLGTDGAFDESTEKDLDCHWSGTWKWNSATRTLHITEWCGPFCCEWSAVLNQELKGQTAAGQPVKLSRKP